MNLKESTTDELLSLLVAVAEELGWSFAIPADDKDQPLQGMVIGTVEYIESILPSNLDEASDVNTPKH